MANKYLVKVASYGKYIATGAALGGAGGYLAKKIKDPRSSTKERLIYGGLRGAAAGAYLGSYTKGFMLRNNSHAEDIKDHLNKFKATKASFKTKAEADRHFRTHMHKAHPDKGGNTEHFQKLSRARDAIKSSEWFNKLAALNNRYIRHVI